MYDGYWVLNVERARGRATTSTLFSDHGEAPRHALDTQTRDVCAMVVSRRQFATNRDLVNRCLALRAAYGEEQQYTGEVKRCSPTSSLIGSVLAIVRMAMQLLGRWG